MYKNKGKNLIYFNTNRIFLFICNLLNFVIFIHAKHIPVEVFSFNKYLVKC